LRYIQSMTYGGSFLGSVTLNSKETADERDIQAFASLSVNKGLFSAKGSTDFQNTLATKGSNVSVFINAQWVGGADVEQDYRNPETLNNMFKDWDGSWRAHPAPITVVTRRWTDSADVQDVLNSKSPEDREIFNVADITHAISTQISNENAQVTLTASSVRRAQAWREIENDPAVQTCLNDLSRDVTAQLVRIDLLDDLEILTIQLKWLAGDYTWFKADSLNARYVQCVDSVEVTPAPTPVPTPAPTQKTCTDTKRNGCTAHPIDWYQADCSTHGAGYTRIGWEYCSTVFSGRYICRRTWTCSQAHDAPDCCR